MHLAVERGVPQEERRRVALGSLTDWDAARAFLEVTRCGSFRSAAERLEPSLNAVRERAGDIERQTNGVRLASSALSGEIRVAVAEGLGTFWIAPRLCEFHRSFPNIAIDLRCTDRLADVSRHEADIAIQLSQPTARDIKQVRLGRMHLMFFASEQYLATYGEPKTVAELAKHQLVMQLADETIASDAFANLFPGWSERELAVMKTDVASANYWAVANGAGIGMLPTCARALGGNEKMLPLDIDARWSLDIWLSYRPDSDRIPRMRHMIDWLTEAFNPARHPWFGDDFVHPRELEAVYMGEPPTHSLGGSIPTEGR